MMREALVLRTSEGPLGIPLERVNRELVSDYGLRWAFERMVTGEPVSGERFTAICVVDL